METIRPYHAPALSGTSYKAITMNLRESLSYDLS
jgi:hypothetical protein